MVGPCPSCHRHPDVYNPPEEQAIILNALPFPWARTLHGSDAMTFVPIRPVLAACLVVVPFAVAAEASPSSTPTLQTPVGARLVSPRRIAATSSGQFVVTDYRGRLHLLTKRGDFVGTVFQGARAVTAGGGKVFVATDDSRLVTLDERDGKVLASVGLGLGEAPVGLSYDRARSLIWMAFRSGMVQARRADGSIALQPSAAVTGPLSGLVDVAVDSGAGVVWVSQGREALGGMIFGLKAEDGARTKVVGADGQGPAKVASALAVGADGRLYVADIFQGKVGVVGADGAAQQAIAVPPTAAGATAQPAGLAFMANGDLLVANLFTRLERFGDGSPLPACSGDADCDGMGDQWEASRGLDPSDPRDALADADADGLSNLAEFALGTNPGAADSDGDGYPDGQEPPDRRDPLIAVDRVPMVVASAGEYAPGKVTLSASVSNVGDAGNCMAAWTQTGGPTVKLVDASGFAPSFVARAAGTYRFSVTASCGGVSSDAAEVAAKVLNLAPIPDAPRVASVEVGRSLTLAAQRSSDANGDALGFGWEQLSGPAVLGASAGSSIAPRFSAPGAYRFKVTVADRAGAASEAEVDVVALGGEAVAAASVVSPVVGVVGQQVALDASASHRIDGASFAWRQVAGSAVALAGADAPLASFVPAVPGRYAFAVEVFQGGVASPPAFVEVFVGAGQALPVAVASAPAVAAVNTTVALDGSNSSSAGGNIEYAWRQVSGPGAGLGSTAAPVASAYLFAPGSYEFELTVRDGGGVGVPARVRVEARADGKSIPVARVTAPATARVGERVALDGGKSTGARKFLWTQLGGPWVLVGPEAVQAFRPVLAGSYVFELEVDDGLVRSAPVRTVVVVSGDERGE